MNQKQDKSLQLNIIFAILGQVLSLGINLVSKNALRRSLGVEYLGLQSIYGNFSDVFSFAFTGIGVAMLFQLYGAMAKEDHNYITAIYSYFNKLCKYISVGILVIGFASTALLIVFVNADIKTLEVIVGYHLYLLSIIVLNRYIFKQYFIIASLKRYLVTMILTLTDLLFLSIQLICLFVLKNYLSYLLCTLIKNTVITLWLHLTIKRRYSYVLQKASPLAKEEQKLILKNVGDLLVSRIGSVLVNNTDSILISSLITTVMAGYYSNYQFVLMGVASLTGSFFEAIVAKIGHIVNKQSKNVQFKSFLTISYINIAITGITCTCIYWLVQDFLLLWMGPDALLPMSIVTLVTINHYLDTTHKTLASYRLSAGLFHNVKKVVLLRGLSNLILSILFGKLFGLWGILFATIISDIITMQWYEPYLMYKYFNKSIWHEIFFQTAAIISTIVTIYISGFLVSDMPVSILGLFIKAFICGILSLLCYGVFFILFSPLYKLMKERSFALE